MGIWNFLFPQICKDCSRKGKCKTRPRYIVVCGEHRKVRKDKGIKRMPKENNENAMQ